MCIGENATIQGHYKIYDSCGVVIGNNVYLGSNVLITTDNDVNPLSKRACAKTVVIEDSVWIGSGSIIVAGVHIGRCSKIITGSVVLQVSMITVNPASVC